MNVRALAVFLVGCGEAGWSHDPAEVESMDAEALMQRPGDFAGTLECGLAGGDVEMLPTCEGLLVTSCTDQRSLLASYGGGFLWRTTLTGTDNLVQVPDDPFSVLIRTTVGREAFVVASVQCIDADQDGYLVTEDCNDNNAAVNPAATEICNGYDDDCDPLTDEAGTASKSLAGVYTDVTAQLTPGFSTTVGEAESLNLCAGTWMGSVTMSTNAAAINGYPDAASVTLDANGARYAITEVGGGVQFVNDLTVTGATGAGVYCDSTTLVMERSVITENSGDYAGGLEGRNCHFILNNSSVHDNFGPDAGAAYLFGGQFELHDSSVTANFGNVGGVLLNGGIGAIYSSTFDGNLEAAEGRDLWVFDGSLHVEDSDFGPNDSAQDDSAVNVRYLLSGGGAASAHFGAGTYQGSFVGLGRDFACSTFGTSYSCSPLVLP
jgi:hypothetical protein